MIRLGHIEYANCFPVHASFIDRGPPPGVELVVDVPAGLNRALAAGTIDVAPCSSIEYARHAGTYRVLPGLVIGSQGPVQSILLESSVPITDLADRTVAVPTASATSVVLLRALLEKRYGVSSRLAWFDQAAIEDPLVEGASAALRIGDVALRRRFPAGREVLDLGALWTEWTGLPFAFAVWQVAPVGEKGGEVAALGEALLASRAYFHEHIEALAARHAHRFRLPVQRLVDYWRSLSYSLDTRMVAGLLRFFTLAAELGEAPAVAELAWFDA